MISLRKAGSALAVTAALLTSACSDTNTSTEPIVAAKLQVVGSSAVSTQAGFPVVPAIRVRLLTKGNAPVSRQVVHFTVTNGAILSADSSFTDENGEAAVGVTLGAIGDYVVTATAAGVAPVTITATARAPIPVAFAVANGDAQAGFANEAVSPISAYVGDQSGVPAVGVPVTFTVTGGGGSVTQTTVLTDVTGVATTTFVLGVAGTQSVRATTPGLTAVSFTATFADPCVNARPVTIPFAPNRSLESVDCLLPSGRYIEYFDVPVSAPFSIADTSTAFVPSLTIRSGTDTVAIANAATTGTTFKAFLAAGTYRVGASSTTAGATGAYKLRTTASPATVTGCEPAYIMKGATTGAQTIAATDCQLTYNDLGGNGSQLHYGDQYFIYLKAGQAMTITQSGTADHLIRVFNPAGTLLVQRDNAVIGGTEAVTVTAGAAGIYVIQAATFNNAAGGTPPDVGGYTLTIT